jgi:putative ABC transport system ATP-binding protein
MNRSANSAILEMADLVKEYPEPSGMLRVLRRLNLTVRRGEIVMITGPSGSGKTTLLQIAGCMIRATAGTIRVASTDVSRSSEAQRLEVRRRHLGFVFQSFHLLNALPVIENVSLALRLRRQPVELDRARAILERLGLGSKVWKYPAQLSGGEKQRVAIARAMVGTPDLLLADEPTSQLDSNAARVIGEMLRDAAHELNMGIVVTTHDPRLGNIADRKVALKEGVLYESDPAALGH